MAKRKNYVEPKYYTNFMCSGCQLVINTEISLRYVSRCGHPLCYNCLSKFKTTVCPICKKRGRFNAVQTNTPTTAVQMNSVPPILNPEFIPFLYQVINQLNPRSFVKLARSCKKMSEMCLQSSEVKIYHNVKLFSIMMIRFGLVFSLHSDIRYYGDTPFDYSGDDRGKVGSAESRGKLLSKTPFRFKFEKVYILTFPLTRNFIAEIRTLLSQFAVRSIPILVASKVIDWEGFVQFVKDFRSSDVEVVLRNSREEPDFIPEEYAIFLLQNPDRFHSPNIVSDTAILEASVRRLYLKNVAISQKTFVSLLVKLANSTDEVIWKIGRQPFEFCHYGAFEVTDVNHDEDISGPLPEARPLIFCERGDVRPSAFVVFRKDGKRLKCYAGENYVVFHTPHLKFELEK